MKHILIVFLVISFSLIGKAQESSGFEQPQEGPGGKNYLHTAVTQYDYADKANGFWLYEPAQPTPASANVIVFIHGYGALNPMIYGGWIKHLVKQGNVVIFPRYQKNLISPSPKHFVENVLDGVHMALDTLRSKGHVHPVVENFSIVGHSYGGVLSANLAVNYKRFEIPQPKAVMLVSPGTGPFSGGLLDSYEKMPENTNLLVMVSENDRIVGDEIGKLVYNTASNVRNRNLVRQYADYEEGTFVTAGHNESYSVDEELDSGLRNATTRRAMRISKIDVVDYYGYWKLFDALNAYTRDGILKEYAFGGTPEQTNLGSWGNGSAIKVLQIEKPDNEEQMADKMR
jgi:acetyl esterase/lipase